MPKSVLKQSFQWAIVTRRGAMLLASGQCPIYWHRNVAQRECNQWTKAAKDDEAYHVEKVTVLAVHRG